MAEGNVKKKADLKVTATEGGVTRRLGELGGRTLIIIAVLIAIIAASYRLDLRIDASADGRFSIQDALESIITGLETEVEIVAVWPRETDDPQHDELVTWLDARLAQIAERGPLVSYRQIDSVIDQPALETFAEQHGEALSDSVYVIGAGRPFRMPVTPLSQLTLQRDLGGALIAVSHNERTPVYVLQGHGELPWRSDDDQSQGSLLHRLSLSGFDFDPQQQSLDAAALSQLGRIPGDGVLIIAGPTAPLGPETLAMFAAYLRDGGSALLLLDHRCPDDLALFLRDYGILVARGVPTGLESLADHTPGRPAVVLRSLDRSLRGADRDFVRLALSAEQLNEQHPVSKQSQGSNRLVVSPLSTDVQITNWRAFAEASGDQLPASIASYVSGLSTPPPSEATTLAAMASSEAWLAAPNDRTPAPSTDERPPFGIGHALSFVPHVESANPEDGSRLVVWGSRQLATDRWVANPQFVNDLLLTDAVSWLANRGESTPIAVQEFRRYQVDATETSLWIIMAALVAFIPCACIGAAMLSWWERR
ncbi:MAG: Gldg family protein [Planctomycetota bacterium]|jgi:hypothetical protein|nr:Gldg family protein [Planctomycetota bacterium]